MIAGVRLNGGMAEWLKATVLKTVVPLRVPGVRIPLPPQKENLNSFRVKIFLLEEGFEQERGRENICFPVRGEQRSAENRGFLERRRSRAVSIPSSSAKK